MPEGDLFGSTSFAPACENHDVCYGTCDADKFECDWNLGHEIQSACNANGDACPVAGFAYFAGVSTPWGQNAFDAAQGDCVCSGSGYGHAK